MSDCNHTVTQNKSYEAGSWCSACGEKVFGVETRKCGDCAHYLKLIDGSICKRCSMVVTQDMRVTFKIVNGSCWTSKEFWRGVLK